MVGSGFAIAPTAVVTADHVVRDADPADVVFQPRRGAQAHVARIERDPEHDVAVLFLDTPLDGAFVVAQARAGASWRVTAQPLGNDPRLTGTVTDLARTVVNRGGTPVELLQLRVDQVLGSYRGYSGSAVVVDGPAGGVVGVLVEQVPHRQGRGQAEASNVLYAVPIQYVVDRFGLAPGAEVIPRLLEGLAGLGADYAAWIENFLVEYLGRTGEPVPFGGRGPQLAKLTAWLTDADAAPYALVTAEAGRGKSALLSRWAAHVSTLGLAHVVFVPISLRFGTAQAGVSLPALAARLADYHGDAVTTAERTAEQWQAEITTHLRRTPRGDKPLLVVLDGLDEATDWEPGAHLFPANPPPGVRVLVSARFVAGDTDETGWRTRLNWSSPALADSVALPPLDQAGVSDVLLAMGNPLAHLVTRVDLVGELHRLSEGDPLLVRLYVDELRERGGDATGLTAEELPSIDKGMRGYFDRWRRELERVWRARGHQPAERQRDLQDFLDALASALGPLTVDDLAELNPDAPTGFALTWLLKDVERFVIGDGVRQGFVFSHPRFAMFFHEMMGRREREKWTSRFLDYGRRTLAQLRAGTREPASVSTYVLNFHGAHLEAAHAPSEDLFALLDTAWLDAWHAIDGTDAGFLNDCERAWRRAEVEVGRGSEAKRERAVETMFVGALARGSVAARSNKVPPELLGDAVREGVLTAAQALAICRRMTEEFRRADAVVALAPVLPAAWLDECLAIAATLRRPQSRAYVITHLVPLLSGPSLLRARALAESLPEPQSRAWALAAVGSRLPGAERAHLAEAVLSDLTAVADDRERGRGLLLCAEFLTDEAMARAISLAALLPNRVDAVKALCALAAHAPDPDRVLDLASPIADAVPRDHDDAARVLVPLANHRLHYRGRALEALATMGDQRAAASLLIKARRWVAEDHESTDPVLLARMHAVLGAKPLVPHWVESLSPGARAQALRLSRSVENSSRRTRVAAHLLAFDGVGASPEAVAEVLHETQLLDHEDRAHVLTLLARCHTGAARSDLLREALRSAETASDVRDRLAALAYTIERLPDGDRAAPQAAYVDLCRHFLPEPETLAVLKKIGAGLDPAVVDPALEVCAAIEPVATRVSAYQVVADIAPADRQEECLRRALAEALSIDDVEARLAVLRSLTDSRAKDRIGKELDDALFTTVGELPDEWDRANKFRGILPLLSCEESKHTAVRSLLRVFRPNEYNPVTALFTALPTGLPEDIVADLTSLVEEHATDATPWLALIRHLPPEQVVAAVGKARSLPPPHHRRPFLRFYDFRADSFSLPSAIAHEFGRLPSEARRRLLPVVLTEDLSVNSLLSLAPEVPEDLRPAVVEHARGLDCHAKFLLHNAVEGVYPADLTARLLEAALAHPVKEIPFDALHHVLARTPPAGRDRLATRVIRRVATHLDGLRDLYRWGPREWRPRVAAELVRHLAARSPEYRERRGVVLLKVIGTVRSDDLPLLEDAIRSIDDPADRVAALAGMIGRQRTDRRHLWELVVEALHEADPVERETVLAKLLTSRVTPTEDEVIVDLHSFVRELPAAVAVPLLLSLALRAPAARRRDLLAEALDLATTPTDARDRDAAVEKIAHTPRPVPELVPRVLRAIVDMWSPTPRRTALAGLAKAFATWPEAIDFDTVHPTWRDALRTVSVHPRPVQVHEVAALAAMGTPSGVPRPAALKAFASALTKVGTWWD